MKKPVIIETEKNAYRMKLKYSDLLRLRNEFNIDLMTNEGTQAIDKDPNAIRVIFWVGIMSGEQRVITENEAYDIFDEIIENVEPQQLGEYIGQAIAIKGANQTLKKHLTKTQKK